MDRSNADGRKKTLMIVEDEILVAMTLRDELEDAGYHVLDLTDRHEQAVAVARENAPDLALVISSLPAGMMASIWQSG